VPEVIPEPVAPAVPVEPPPADSPAAAADPLPSPVAPGPLIPQAPAEPDLRIVLLVDGDVVAVVGANASDGTPAHDRVRAAGQNLGGLDPLAPSQAPEAPPAESPIELPMPVPAPSGAAGAAGSSGGGGGGASFAGFALAAALLCLVAPGLLRRLRTSALVWRPVAFVSPLERPPGLQPAS
jgi:hypothetical protein